MALLSAGFIDEVHSVDLAELLWTARLVALIASVALLSALLAAAALTLAAVALLALLLLSATTSLALLLSATLLDELLSFDRTELFGTA